MSYLVISDIHGALEGPSKLYELMDMYHPQAILCLGDVLYHGPRNELPEDYQPKEVISILNEYAASIICVKGNCDGEVDQMVLNFPVLSESNSFYYGNRKIFMYHGHHTIDKFIQTAAKSTVFLSGHTHIPVIKLENGCFFINPGSISLPKGGHPKTYGLLTEDGFTIYTLDHTEYMKMSFTE